MTMMTVILLYGLFSLLALLIIYGACLAAARADRTFGEKKYQFNQKAQAKEPVVMEHPQQQND